MLTRLSIIALLFSASSMLAQQQDYEITGTNIMQVSKSGSVKIDGSPYINDEYLPVKINDQEIIYSARYNAFNGEMEVKLNDDENPIALDFNSGYTVEFIGTNKTYGAYHLKDDKGNLYKTFLVKDFVMGDYELLVKEHIEYNEEKPSKTGYDKAKPANYERVDDEFFIKLADNRIVAVPKKSKDLAELIPEKEDELEDFIKANKIKTKNREDLIKFINYIANL